MGKIRDYELLEEFKGDETFVVETDEGTKSLSVGAIKAHITTAVEEKADMLNQNDIEVETDTASDYRLTITVGTKTVTTPNLKGKSIKEIKLVSGHLLIFFTDETEIDLGVLDGSIPIYGVCRDIPSHSPALTRVGDAAGLVAEAAVGNENVRNDFDKIYPWCDIKRCTLADDGTVISYEGDPEFTTDGSNGQVMVEIPVYWKAHYLNESGTKEYTYISKEKADSRYFVPKRFIDKNGNILDKIYIGAFGVTIDADSKAESKAGTGYPIVKSFENMKAYCEARGDGWHPYGIWDYEVIKDLFTVEFATLDSQSIMLGLRGNLSYSESYAFYSSAEMWSKDDTTGLTETVTSFVEESNKPSLFIGQEVCIYAADTASATGAFDTIEGNAAIARRRITGIEEIDLQWTDDEGTVYHTSGYLYNFEGAPVKVDGMFRVKESFSRNGLTDYINMPSGELRGNDFARPFKYRHMENIYCSQDCFLFGALVKDGKYYVCEDPSEYGDVVTETYKEISYSRPVTGFIVEMGCDNEYPYVCFPKKTGGTSDTDYCDEFRKEGGRIDPEKSYIMQLASGGSLAGGLYRMETMRTTLATSRLSYSSEK